MDSFLRFKRVVHLCLISFSAVFARQPKRKRKKKNLNNYFDHVSIKKKQFTHLAETSACKTLYVTSFRTIVQVVQINFSREVKTLKTILHFWIRSRRQSQLKILSTKA